MKRTECDCPACQECCQREPGWFLPDEVPRSAAFLGLTSDEFVRRYLTEHTLTGVTTLAPAMRTSSSACIFYDDGKCAIHPVRPYECRTVFGCEAPRRHRRIRDFIARRWR